jgi:rhomboid protease GluP
MNIQCMNTYFKKVKHILPAFLVVAFGTVGGLLLLRWFFCLKYPVIAIKEEYWTRMTILFAVIPVLLWLRPKFRVLIFSHSANGRFGAVILSWIILGAMVYATQDYLTTAAGTLQRLSDIKEINNVKYARFYTIEKFSVVPAYGGSHLDLVSGRRGKTRIEAYFVVPVLPHGAGGIDVIHKYWFGVKFQSKRYKRLRSEEIEKEIKEFYQECIRKMNAYDFYTQEYFERKPYSIDRENFLKAVEARTREKTDEDFVILEPVKTRYENRNGKKLLWALESVGIGISVFLLFLMIPGLDISSPDKF